ncbi:MAG: 3-methyl-2-oxobutanoate hydroxymethyltransferase [Betaproteobacteria bacterium]|nr:3-methyl-2-oxobutanoate hydroxymethyltransferase [Betaproteobacteria bacterium]
MRVTLTALHKMCDEGDRITMLTCYDGSFAGLLEAAGVDVLLVGDSLGNVIQAEDTTLPVTMDHMVYHTRCVARGSKRAFLVTDMPFGSFQVSPAATFENAARLMAVGAQMVKVEGGQTIADTVEFLTSRGIPVCGHVGLTPQSVHQLGGYRVQGKTDKAARQLIRDAQALEQAGAGMIVLELVPASLSAQVSEKLRIPTIGIGAGKACDGQVLVLYDMLNIFPGKKARFVKNYMEAAGTIQGAVEAFVKEVKTGSFPAPEHSF